MRMQPRLASDTESLDLHLISVRQLAKLPEKMAHIDMSKIDTRTKRRFAKQVEESIAALQELLKKLNDSESA